MFSPHFLLVHVCVCVWFMYIDGKSPQPAGTLWFFTISRHIENPLLLGTPFHHIVGKGGENDKTLDMYTIEFKS